MSINKSPLALACIVITVLMTAPPIFAADKPYVPPTPVLLWPDGAPGATGNSEEDKPAISVYLPDADKNTSCAIVVCPGGGFTHRATDYEGVIIAEWLRAHGIAAFVLRYRIHPLYKNSDAVADAHRAMQFLRAHADEYKISTDRIGMIGFSAGSELACLAAFSAADGKPDAADIIDRQSSRLNFMVLGYGSSQGQVNRTNTPPTFFFCTAEDRGHATGMIDLFTAMYDANIPAEIHIFPNGEHGVGLANGDAVLGMWPQLMYNWIRAQNFLTASPRVNLSGHVKLDGQPLPHGSITFVPLDNSAAPPVTAYIMNTDTATADYKFGRDPGPIPGKYRVEIRQDAVVWMSNNRDPFNRAPTAERIAHIRSPGWGAPTIDKVYLFTKTHPGDANDLTVEIKPGDKEMNFEVFSK
jgi:acetyl esterase/lipase